MSPEQAVGERHLDGRSDVYSLAGVIFEMLSGSPPFVGATTTAIVAQRFDSEIPDLKKLVAVHQVSQTRQTRQRMSLFRTRIRAKTRNLFRVQPSTSRATPIGPKRARLDKLSALGALIGLGLAIASGAAMSSLLFGVSAFDPPTLAATLVLFGIVAAVASLFPAVRASNVDAAEVLRSE